MNVSGQTFLVSGGASGLGLACATRLVRAGGKVVVFDRNTTGAESLSAERPGGVGLVAGDVTSESQVQAAVQRAVALSDGAGLRGAINCAGIATGERVVGRDGPHTLDGFVRVIHVNLIGTFNVTRLAAAAMAANAPDAGGERGVIVNTASVCAEEGQIGQAAYSASKGGVVGMTLPIARELAKLGIRCVAISPGAFETPMVGGFPDKVQTSLRDQAVFPPRLGNPDEFAALAQHIIENTMLNGCTLRIDGAVRMAAK